jgi:hypothetical protein
VAQQDQHRHIAERLPGIPTREDEIAAAAVAQFLKGNFSRIAIDASVSGTRCSLPIFVCSAGWRPLLVGAGCWLFISTFNLLLIKLTYT